MDDRWPTGSDLLKTEPAPAMVSEVKVWSNRAGPQRSVGGSRHLHGDGRHLVGVQFLWG
jgi:hypothetical protein